MSAIDTVSEEILGDNFVVEAQPPQTEKQDLLKEAQSFLSGTKSEEWVVVNKHTIVNIIDLFISIRYHNLNMDTIAGKATLEILVKELKATLDPKKADYNDTRTDGSTG